jgi:hypothetical protein
MTDQTLINRDEEHLKILSLVYKIWGYVSGACALFMGAYFTLFGVLFAVLPKNATGHDAPPAVFGAIFGIVGGAIILLGAAYTVCVFLTSKYLMKHTNLNFCFAVACVTLLSMPAGTILGVFTLIVLSRDSVKPMFSGTTAQQ